MFSQYIEINDNKKGKDLSKIGIDHGINEMIKYQNEKEMNDQETPAYFACCSGDITSIKILIDNGADFGKPLQNGISPFLAAIMNGHHDVVKLLLKDSNAKIGDINQTTETGIAPLSWAVYYNFPDIVALLLMKGADITHPLKSNGMASVHLACFHNRFECLSILAHSTNEDIYEKSEIGDTPLHIALEHSLKCAYFLIDRMKDTNFHLKNSHNYTVRDIAIMSGHYDLAHKLPNNGIFDQKGENKNKIDEFDEICHAFASGDVSIAEKVFYRFINQLNLTENHKNELIEYACIGGCAKFVEILSKIIDFKQFPIALFAVKYGLIDWISEIEKFGGDLMIEIDNKTIFDEAVDNSDYNFLFSAFNAVDYIPPNVIKRIINKSIEINDVNTIIIISNALSEKKFCKFLDHSDVFISSLTSISFNVFKNNLDPKVEIKLSDHIQNISLKMVGVLLSNYGFQKEDLKLAITKAIKNNRNDIAFVILEKNMNIAKEIRNDPKINELTNNNKLKAITKINLLIKDEIMPENEKIKELKNIFCSIFDLGNLSFEDNLSLAIYAGKKIKNLWILKALPKYCLEKFYLLTISIKYNNLKLLFQKLIQIFEHIYGRKKAGVHFLNSFRFIDFEEIEKSGKADEFVNELIEITKDQYITEVDDNNQTVFHLVSKFSFLNDKNINLIFETINSLDLEYLIKYRTKNGRTILMEFANSGNYKAIEYFSNKNLYSFYNRDIYGDNILHAILNSRNASNNKMFSCFCSIIKKCPELILQKNRDNESPFMIAAKKGFNGILALMTTIYPIKVLDSIKAPILHIAAQNNYPETIRYIVQHLHVNVNIKSEDGLTALHIAAMTSSIHAYEELISLGGNPLITCREMTAIDYALEHGSEKMIEYVMKQPSFKYELSTPKVIFHLAKNPEGYSSFVLALTFFEESAIHLCDSKGMSLISAACIKNNRKTVSDLLMLGCEPNKDNLNGQNSIHICALYDSIGCSDLILNHILKFEGPDGVKNILNKSDLNGDLPIHIAAKNGSCGFVAHLLCACNQQDLTKENNKGFTPFIESIQNGHIKVAGILAYYTTDILNLPIDSLITNLSNELKEKWENEFVLSNEYHSAKEIVDKFKLNKMQPYTQEMKIITENENALSCIQLFIEYLKHHKIETSNKFLNKCKQILSNSVFRTSIIYLLEKDIKNSEFVKLIFDNMKNMKSQRLLNISYVILFPLILNVEDPSIFIKLIKHIDSIKIKEIHPLFAWIENGLITIAETTKNSNDIINQIQDIIQLITFILKDREMKHNISYPILPVPIHEFSSFIFNIKNVKYRKVQLHFAHLTKYSNLLSKNPSLSIEFCNRIGNGSNELLNYVMNNDQFEFDVYERVIQITCELYDDPILKDDEREMIMVQCIAMISNKDNLTSLKNQISSWVFNSMKIINNFGIEYYKNILSVIPQKSLSEANESLLLILAIGSPDIANVNLIRKGLNSLKIYANKIENEKFKEYRDLDSILEAFNEGSNKFIPYKFAFDGTPVIKLSSNELKNLRTFGEILETVNNISNNLNSAFEKGKSFRDNPSIENAAELVSIVRFAIRETYGINPFVVQCLTVAAMLLHRINKIKRKDLKGRIAQVATGEGKSIIVAMLAACIGLTGSCVDVISSSPYLAKRDAAKFKPFYEKLGLKCGTVDQDDYTNGFDYHILYSTNTGFEFALLREGISGNSVIETTLLYKNVKRKRPRMTAIVDEADNLFIDTAMNSARIAQEGTSKQMWMLRPIWLAVLNNIYDTESTREMLSQNANTEEKIQELNNTTNEQLATLIKNAITAISLKKNVDYIIGKNKETNENEIQIVDAQNTGRIQYGSRWSNGLHEFIEIKENLPIHEQYLIGASISHPSFFELYEEIFGLTGTLGEESERNEILQIYHVDSFDVPPNKKCLRKRDKTLIVASEEEKYKYIIDTINKIKQQRRPILIIVYSIDESQKLSNLLNKKQIDHFLLNDQQRHDEDFIIDKAGYPGVVTIATNTAGRGTDIHLDKVSIMNGGLHTLITFFPANLRVECQALGRSARQGQPGSCQIIFTSRKFGNDDNETSEEILKRVYEQRTREITVKTAFRLSLFEKENKIFEILTQYFDYIRNLKMFLELPENEFILENNYFGINSHIVLKELSQCWSNFYTNLLELNYPQPDSFEKFLDQWDFENKFPLLSDSFNNFFQDEALNSLSFSISLKAPSYDINEIRNNSNNILDSLVNLGFEKELCENALNCVDNDIEKAIYLLFNGISNKQNKKKKIDINENNNNNLLEELISMGFDRESSEIALKKSKYNIQIAVSILTNENSQENNIKSKKRSDDVEMELINDELGINEDLIKNALNKASNNDYQTLKILLNKDKQNINENITKNKKFSFIELYRKIRDYNREYNDALRRRDWETIIRLSYPTFYYGVFASFLLCMLIIAFVFIFDSE